MSKSGFFSRLSGLGLTGSDVAALRVSDGDFRMARSGRLLKSSVLVSGKPAAAVDGLSANLAPHAPARRAQLDRLQDVTIPLGRRAKRSRFILSNLRARNLGAIPKKLQLARTNAPL